MQGLLPRLDKIMSNFFGDLLQILEMRIVE